MSRQKMLKHQKGRNRPTEVRATNNITNEEVASWIRKIDEAAMTSNVQEKIKAVAKVLWELIGKVRSGEVHYSVLMILIGRRNLIASLDWLRNEYGDEWAKEIDRRRKE